ncbi:MAG: heme biosynthesis protein HemY [Rhodospirillales bacterium]|nr:heme biosynthesis protein HemY [Rhodospirillales bacterium]
MVRWLLYFVAAAALVAAAVWLADNTGTVTLSWRGWRVDTSVAVVIAAGAIVLVAAGILHRLWLLIAHAPGDLRQSWRRRRRERGYEALTRGMVAIAAGDADEARRQSRRAEGLLDQPPLTLLLAAQAAQLSGDEQAAARFFSTMSEKPETEFLGVRGLLGQAIKRGDRPGALDLARRAWRLRRDSAWASDVLFDLETKEGRWLDARATLGEATRRGALTKETARRREAALLVELARQAAAEGRGDDARQLAGKAHRLRPALVPAAATYARALLEGGKSRKATAAIERTFAFEPHAGLAELYVRARGATDALGQAREVQRLVETQPAHPESRFAYACALKAAKLWGEARHALEGFGDNPPARACRLMAEIEETERGDLVESRRWLMRANVADPDPAWVCDGCGTAAADWGAVCPKCGTFDALHWRTPPRHAALVAPQAAPARLASTAENNPDPPGP